MMFKKGIKANLITLRERKARYIIAIKNQNKEDIGADFYFCEPASPHQKGEIENGNSIITF